MTNATKTTSKAKSSKTAACRGKQPAGGKAPSSPTSSGASSAKLRAAAILEVLAGQRTAREAATDLGLSVNHYYLMERRALAGLLAACQPLPRGPRPEETLERKVQSLQRQLQRSQRECQRQAALVRATQRAVGLPVREPADNGKGKGRAKAKVKAKPRRKKAPSVRALRAAQTLREEEKKTLASDGASTVQTTVESSVGEASTLAPCASDPPEGCDER